MSTHIHRRLWELSALASVLAWSSLADAQSSLLLPGSTDPELAGQIEMALGEQARVRPVPLDEAMRRLRERLGPEGHDSGEIDRLLRQGREAYVRMDLGSARSSFERALEALLRSELEVAAPLRVAEILFGMELIERFAPSRTRPPGGLRAALTVAPSFQPAPEWTSEEVQGALRSAREALSREPSRRLSVARSPEDAVLRVDGEVVAAGATAVVRGSGPHLVTLERAGFVPRSQLVETVGEETSISVVLARAEGDVLAAQALDAHRRAGTSSGLELGEACAVARAAEIPFVVEIQPGESGIVTLVLRESARCERVGSASAAPTTWEPAPYIALARTLAGEPAGEPVVAVSAPSRVSPGAELHLDLSIRDPASFLAQLEATCGAEERTVELAARSEVRLSFRAPTTAGTLDCGVRGRAHTGRILTRFPLDGSALRVEVRIEEGIPDWVWALGAGILVAVGAGVAGGLLYEPEERLVFNAR
jgi:hypothetical protein